MISIDQNPWFCRRPTAKGERGETFFIGRRRYGRREYAQRLDGHMAFTNKSFTLEGVSPLPFEGIPHHFHFTANFEAKILQKCELPFWKSLWPTQHKCFPDYAYHVNDVMSFFGCKSRKRLFKVLRKYGDIHAQYDWELWHGRVEMETCGGFLDADIVNHVRDQIEERLDREWCAENERLANLKAAEIECKRSRGTTQQNIVQLRALGIVA